MQATLQLAGLQPGQEVKVIQGPFHAVVDLSDYELTLMVEGRYAGRFRIGIGGDQPELEGAYEIKDKTENPSYYGRDAVVDADAVYQTITRLKGIGAEGILVTPIERLMP